MVAHWARSLSERWLAAALPDRWAHVRAVAARAESVAHVVGEDAELLVAAAWLHDVGYASALVDTGFHPLDGARYLRSVGADDRLAALVAHHSGALLEAEMRGLAEELLAEFPREVSATADALWYADLTTGPAGQRFGVEQRLAEIQDRYGPDHLVTGFVDRACPVMIAAVRRTEARLGSAA